MSLRQVFRHCGLWKNFWVPEPSAWCGQHGGSVAAAVAVRSFHTCPPASTLAQTIKDELEYEKQEMNDVEDSDSALKTPPEGWQLHSKQESTQMKLTRTLRSEQLVVSVNTLGQEDPVGESEENAQYPVIFTVDCVKGQVALRFECMYMEDSGEPPSIRDVSIIPSEEKAQQQQMLANQTYEGPNFVELDERLRTQFGAYLDERNIDQEFGQYLCRLVFDKEQEDYVQWLARLDKFIAE